MAGAGGTYSDTLNRALRDLLTQSGYNPDATTFPGLLGPVYNVLAYGADPTGVADSSGAIEAARDAALSGVRRGIVWFPVGVYRTTRPMGISGSNINAPLHFRGAGQGTQIVYQGAAGTNAFEFRGVSFWTLSDMLLTAASTGATDQRGGVLVGLNGGVWPTGAQCARWRIERVVSQMPGVGFQLSDTNTGVVRDCKHWPSSNSSSVTQAQTIANNAAISHGIYMTGTAGVGFCNDIAIYDFDCQPVNTYATGMASIKQDAPNSSSIRVFSGLLEGSGTPASDKHSIDFAHVYGFTLVGAYAQNTNQVFSDCREGTILDMDRAGSGTTLITGSSARLTVQKNIDQNLQIDAGCVNIAIRDTEYTGTITDNGTGTKFSGVTNAGSNKADRGNHPIHFRTHLSAAVSIAASANTKLTFNATDFDDFGVYSTVTGKFTPGIVGRYHLTVNAQFAGCTTSASMLVNIYKNGVLYDTGSAAAATGGNAGVQLATIVDASAVTDYFEVYAQNQDSAARNVTCSFMGEAL